MSVASPIVNGGGGGGGGGGGSVTELSLAELRDIAARQQAQIDAQLADLRHRQLALSRLRKDDRNNGGIGALAAAVEDRDYRLNRLRLQRRQLDEYRLANAQLAAQLAEAREAFQRRTDELKALDQQVEAMRKLAESQQRQQQQQQQKQPLQQSAPQSQQLHATAALPSPDARLARLREAVLQRRQQSEQLRLKAAAAAAAAVTTTVAPDANPVVAERPPSPPSHQWHRRHHAPRHVIIASACRRGVGQLPAETAAATAQRYREAARLAYEAAAAKEQQERLQQQQQQQQQQQAVSLTPDGIEDLIRLEASAKPEEKRRSLVVVQDPPGAPIGWRAPIARQDEDDVGSECAASTTVDTAPNSAAKADAKAEDNQQEEEDQKTASSDCNKDQLTGSAGPDAKQKMSKSADRCVKFDPLTVLLDAAMEGDLEQIRSFASSTSVQISASNEEGITALHNAVCAGHLDCVRLLVELGADVNAADVDGWTPLHCSVSCNHLALTRLLVQCGAAIYCATRSDLETPLDLCQEGGTIERFLLDEADKLGRDNQARVFAVTEYEPDRPDELALRPGLKLVVLRRSDQSEPDWFWCRVADDAEEAISGSGGGAEGYAPKCLLSLYPPGGELGQQPGDQRRLD